MFIANIDKNYFKIFEEICFNNQHNIIAFYLKKEWQLTSI